MIADDVLVPAAALLYDETNVRWPKPDLLKYLNEAKRQIVTIDPRAGTQTVTAWLEAGHVLQSLPASGRVIKDVPRNLRASLSGFYLWIAHRGFLDYSLRYLSLDTLQLSGELYAGTGKDPRSPCYDAASNAIYLSYMAPSAHKIRIDAEGVPTDLGAIAWGLVNTYQGAHQTSNGVQLFAAADSATVYSMAVGGLTATVAYTLPIDCPGYALDFSADGTTLYVLANTENTLSVFNLAAGTVTTHAISGLPNDQNSFAAIVAADYLYIVWGQPTYAQTPPYTPFALYRIALATLDSAALFFTFPDADDSLQICYPSSVFNPLGL